MRLTGVLFVLPAPGALFQPTGIAGASLVEEMTYSGSQVFSCSISQFARGINGNPYRTMGYSIRYKNLRYTEWLDSVFTATSKPFDKELVLARELYDYKTDSFETKNLVQDAAYAEEVALLAGKLHQFFGQQWNTTRGKASGSYRVESARAGKPAK
jgi:hypothetical protein